MKPVIVIIWGIVLSLLGSTLVSMGPNLFSLGLVSYLFMALVLAVPICCLVFFTRIYWNAK